MLTVSAGAAATLAGTGDPFAPLYEAYLTGAGSPCALALARPVRFARPGRLEDLTTCARPPRSFRYVDADMGAITAQARPGSCRSSACASADG